MTVPRLRRHRRRAQGRLFALVAAGWLVVAGLTLSGSPEAGAYPVAAESVLSWTAEQPATHPPALAYASAVYDSDNQTVVLFGGVEADGTLSDDTWVWDGATWTDYPGSQILAPPAREMASMAFDPKLHQLILFGGLGEGDELLNDTWAWNGVSWNQPPGFSTSPSNRESAAMAYDGSENLVLFGGLGYQTGPTPSTTSTIAAPSTSTAVASTASATTPTALNDTWLWTRSGWVESSATGPSARSGASFAYDSSAHEAVLFGGKTTVAGSPDQGLAGDTWSWTGSAWKRAATATSPGPREGATLVDDRDARGLVLFGGTGLGRTFGDTWLWNGSAWTRSAASGAPSPRAGAAAASPAGDQALLFGGAGSSGVPLGDTDILTTTPPGATTSTTTIPSGSRSTSGSQPAQSVQPGKSGITSTSGGSLPRATVPTRPPAPLITTATLVRRGQSVTLTGSGFRPGSDVRLTFHSRPELVGLVVADALGGFSKTVTVPANATGGSHHFEAAGESSSGQAHQSVVAVRVVGVPGPAGPTTAQTLIMVGAALLIPLAAWLVLGAADRIRARSRHEPEQLAV
jgi:Galactose oxidase, central domain